MSLLPSSRAYSVSEAPKYHRRGRSPSSCARLMRVFITHFVIVCTSCDCEFGHSIRRAKIRLTLYRLQFYWLYCFLLNSFQSRVLATKRKMLTANTPTTMSLSMRSATDRSSTKPMPRYLQRNSKAADHKSQFADLHHKLRARRRQLQGGGKESEVEPAGASFLFEHCTVGLHLLMSTKGRKGGALPSGR